MFLDVYLNFVKCRVVCETPLLSSMDLQKKLFEVCRIFNLVVLETKSLSWSRESDLSHPCLIRCFDETAQ